MYERMVEWMVEWINRWVSDWIDEWMRDFALESSLMRGWLLLYWQIGVPDILSGFEFGRPGCLAGFLVQIHLVDEAKVLRRIGFPVMIRQAVAALLDYSAAVHPDSAGTASYFRLPCLLWLTGGDEGGHLDASIVNTWDCTEKGRIRNPANPKTWMFFLAYTAPLNLLSKWSELGFWVLIITLVTIALKN